MYSPASSLNNAEPNKAIRFSAKVKRYASVVESSGTMCSIDGGTGISAIFFLQESEAELPCGKNAAYVLQFSMTLDESGFTVKNGNMRV